MAQSLNTHVSVPLYTYKVHPTTTLGSSLIEGATIEPSPDMRLLNLAIYVKMATNGLGISDDDDDRNIQRLLSYNYYNTNVSDAEFKEFKKKLAIVKQMKETNTKNQTGYIIIDGVQMPYPKLPLSVSMPRTSIAPTGYFGGSGMKYEITEETDGNSVEHKPGDADTLADVQMGGLFPGEVLLNSPYQNSTHFFDYDAPETDRSNGAVDNYPSIYRWFIYQNKSYSIDNTLTNNAFINKRNIFLLLESDIFDAKSVYTGSGSFYGETLTTESFSRLSKLHYHLAICGIDPFQVAICIKMVKDDSGNTDVDETYLTQKYGDASVGIKYTMDITIRTDIDLPLYYDSGKNIEVISVTVPEEYLNASIGGYLPQPHVFNRTDDSYRFKDYLEYPEWDIVDDKLNLKTYMYGDNAINNLLKLTHGQFIDKVGGIDECFYEGFTDNSVLPDEMKRNMLLVKFHNAIYPSSDGDVNKTLLLIDKDSFDDSHSYSTHNVLIDGNTTNALFNYTPLCYPLRNSFKSLFKNYSEIMAAAEAEKTTNATEIGTKVSDNSRDYLFGKPNGVDGNELAYLRLNLADLNTDINSLLYSDKKVAISLKKNESYTGDIDITSLTNDRCGKYNLCIRIPNISSDNESLYNQRLGVINLLQNGIGYINNDLVTIYPDKLQKQFADLDSYNNDVLISDCLFSKTRDINSGTHKAIPIFGILFPLFEVNDENVAKLINAIIGKIDGKDPVIIAEETELDYPNDILNGVNPFYKKYNVLIKMDNERWRYNSRLRQNFLNFGNDVSSVSSNLSGFFKAESFNKLTENNVEFFEVFSVYLGKPSYDRSNNVIEADKDKSVASLTDIGEARDFMLFTKLELDNIYKEITTDTVDASVMTRDY